MTVTTLLKRCLALPIALLLISVSPAGAGDGENLALSDWTTPFGMPPFDRLLEADFIQAYDEAARGQNEVIAAIIRLSTEPTFENTIAPYERSRSTLYRVLRTFLPISQAVKTDRINEAAEYIYPAFAAHEEAIFLNHQIFDRVDKVYRGRNDLGLDDDQTRLVELIHQEFIKYGVGVDPERKPRLEEIAAELAGLNKEFSDNLTSETNAYDLLLSDREDLGAMPESVANAARERAKELGHDCECWSFSLQPLMVRPFLKFSPNRSLRERIYRANSNVGANDNEWNNQAILNRILALRAERASIMGFDTYAEFKTAFAMAETPANAEALLMDVYEAALQAISQEGPLLEAMMRADNVEGPVQAWDWAYYAEKLRVKSFQVSEEEVRPYLPLEAVRDGAFELARRLFGLKFEHRPDWPRWHPDQQVFEVLDSDGKHVGILMQDYYIRENKRTGAWTDEIRLGEAMDQVITPIAANTFRYVPPTDGTPALLNFEEGETLFHEFGHALHTLLSRQRYVRLSGFNYLPRDGVEYPSTILEYWYRAPAYLKAFGKHWKTGEPIPDDLINRIEAAASFDLAHRMARLAASGVLDLRLHEFRVGEKIDASKVERTVQAELELPTAVGWWYPSAQFNHIVSLGYDAGFYGYLWSDVIAADAFGRFADEGLFDKKAAADLRRYVFEVGAAKPPLAMFEAFRGRSPNSAALLQQFMSH